MSEKMNRASQSQPFSGSVPLPAREAEPSAAELPRGWHNHEGYRAIFSAALAGITANPEFFGPIFQQQPGAAVEFAAEVLAAAIAKAEGRQ